MNIIELAKVYFSALKNVKTVNTLTADDKYSLVDRENKRQQIQILLSQKQNTFSQFFSAFLKSKLNFEHFRKKDDPSSRYITEKTDSEKGD